MLTANFAVAQCAQEAAATLTRNNGLFGGMIETRGFALNQYRLALLARCALAEVRGIDLDLQQAVASGATGEPELVQLTVAQWRPALRTSNSAGFSFT